MGSLPPTGFLGTSKHCAEHGLEHEVAVRKRQYVYRQCRECFNHYQRESRKLDPERFQRNSRESRRRLLAQDPQADRRHNLQRYNGLTLEEFDWLLAQQGHVCAICKQPERENRSLSVDHDHDTGQVRGLLCSRCNITIGKFEDDPALLLAAAQYLSLLTR